MSLSPSAINCWISCRLQFFFKYLASIKLPDVTTEGIDAAVFGSIVHKMMERLYSAILGQNDRVEITIEEIERLRSRVEVETLPAINEAWRKAKPEAHFELTGALLVAKQVAEQYVHSFLSNDVEHAPFWLNQLEVKFSQPFALSVGQNNSRIVLSGYIDRIDEKDGVHRMFDYKTGSDKPEFKTVEGLFERDGKQHNKAALQTLLYSWMFSRQFPEKIHFEPALAAPRQSSGKPTDELRLIEKNGRGKLDHHQLPNVLEEVTWRLRQTLEELFDSEAPFDQTTELKTCQYCDFKGICGR